MDCEACFIAVQEKIEKNEKKGGQYGSPVHTKILQSVRESNNVDATEAHKDAAFNLHAAGIFADCYTDNMLNKNKGDIAYNIIDTNNEVLSDEIISKIKSVEGVFMVRSLQAK